MSEVVHTQGVWQTKFSAESFKLIGRVGQNITLVQFRESYSSYKKYVWLSDQISKLVLGKSYIDTYQ